MTSKVIPMIPPILRRPSRVRVGMLAVIAVALLLGTRVAARAQNVALSTATIEDINAAFDAGTLTSERLVELYLARIAAYDKSGPAINAVIWLNENALDVARERDRERRTTGPRSMLHGIPVVLKDNVDTFDMPTTAGSVVLRSLPCPHRRVR